MDTEALRKLAETWVPPEELSTSAVPRPVRLTRGGWANLALTALVCGVFFYKAKFNHRPDDPILLITFVAIPAWIVISRANSIWREWQLLSRGQPSCGMISSVKSVGRTSRRYEYSFINSVGQLLNGKSTQLSAGLLFQGRAFAAGDVVAVLSEHGRNATLIYPGAFVELARRGFMAENSS